MRGEEKGKGNAVLMFYALVCWSFAIVMEDCCKYVCDVRGPPPHPFLRLFRMQVYSPIRGLSKDAGSHRAHTLNLQRLTLYFYIFLYFSSLYYYYFAFFFLASKLRVVRFLPSRVYGPSV